MTNLTLRREALTALGWTWKRDQDYWQATGEKIGKPWRFLIAPDSMFSGLGDADMSEDIKQTLDIPAIESDPGVAIPMLVEWCTQHGYYFVLSSHPGGDIELLWGVGVNNEDGDQDGPTPAVTGATIPEAIAKAIAGAAR